MNQTATFDYFYGMQAEAYTFFRIPKVLFTDPYFKKLSCEAKVLYGLLLDRMSLSVKNKWFDDQGRVYITFTIEDATEMMGCCRQTAVKLLAAVNTQKSKNHTSGSPKNILQEVQNIDFKKSKKQTSRSPEIISQEVQESDCNNTDSNKTEESNILSDLSIRDGKKNPDADGEVNYYAYRDLIRENIDYSTLCKSHPTEEVNGIVTLMTDTVCKSRRNIIIGKDLMPAAVVRSRLLSLDYSHIEYVLECMGKNTTKVKNIKQYLLAALYNAPVTIGHYYAAEANYDLYGSDRESEDGGWNDQ